MKNKTARSKRTAFLALALSTSVASFCVTLQTPAVARTHGRAGHSASHSSSHTSTHSVVHTSTRSHAGGRTSRSTAVANVGSFALAVDSWLKRPEITHSRVGVEVMELPSGRVLYSHEGEKRLTPASTAKVLTTSCAYELLGGNFQYKTTINGTGPVAGGVLKGNLILEPSQDPTFSRSDLMRLVDDLKNGRGATGERVSQVDGHVFVGGPVEGRESFQPTWLSEDFGQDWMPASSSLVIDRNIAFVSGFPKQFKVSEDRSTGYALLDSLLTSGEASSWVSFDAATGTFHIFRGSAFSPSGGYDPAIKRDGPFVVANPDAFNQAIFQGVLADHGIASGGAHHEKNESRALAEHLSKPLSSIVKYCLYESDNLYAQQLLRSIGYTTLGTGSPSGGKSAKTVSLSLEERGLNRMGAWLSSIGVPNQQVVLFDGCGLSRKDCLSPHALNLVLKHMAGPEVNSPYLSLMHQSGGKDGSGRFNMKTGAMDTVRGITGVLTNFSGQHVAVTAIINGHTPSVKNVRMALGDLIERLKRVQIPATARTAADSQGSAVATAGAAVGTSANDAVSAAGSTQK